MQTFRFHPQKSGSIAELSLLSDCGCLQSFLNHLKVDLPAITSSETIHSEVSSFLNRRR